GARFPDGPGRCPSVAHPRNAEAARSLDGYPERTLPSRERRSATAQRVSHAIASTAHFRGIFLARDRNRTETIESPSGHGDRVRAERPGPREDQSDASVQTYGSPEASARRNRERHG